MDAADVAALIDRYGADAYRFCRRLTTAPADADDLYQQTFLRLMEMSVRLDREQNPRALIFSVASGLYRNSERKRARRQNAAPSFSIDQEDPPALPVSADDTERQVLNRLRGEALRAAIETLKPVLRTAVLLFYAFDLPVEDIARIEHVPAGTVKSRLYKARQLLKTRMEEKGYDGYQN